ncbi:DegT/DnrJ/EryC1/StrS aminotransferase family protein [Flavobacterium sp. PL002]|uniref:DegT/DnrJ/EryC1/StrS family aminotransferase n=1 Tax=Flavobacterium sp. PL002 TaxID=1897058 RepID=UPI0017888405|nr:DegT/DnrJ/EryC1/StrS family aminotransferase [Flavobacterium sp. PL002]MBE0390243.1 putative pyridoxal phosphate-dependent aminotransferase EpsN [Flavobacterium sp. PL002]
MNKDKIWLSLPHMGGGELKYIQQALDTNWVAPVGMNLTKFEEAIEIYLGCGHVAVLNSGTAAIHLGLLLLGVVAGDEVICQTMTFAASANPILYLGATPIFIDSELETWNLCPVALEEAIMDRMANGKKPKVIVAVDLYGVPYKKDEVRAIADKYGIPILEDSAESLGSSYYGKKCGTFGDVSVLSFNGSKIITTSGGGALVTKSKELKEKVIFWATQSKEAALHYQHQELGYNYRMSNVSAGIGRGQMEVLKEHVTLRRKVHEFYVTLFKAFQGVTVFSVPNAHYFSNYWLTTILVHPELTNGIKREDVSKALLANNIESRPLMKPLHLQPVFEKHFYYGRDNAAALFDGGLCLPSSSNLTTDEQRSIKKVFQELFSLA